MSGTKGLFVKFFFCLLLAVFSSSLNGETISIFYDFQLPQAGFAAGQIEKSAHQKKFTVKRLPLEKWQENRGTCIYLGLSSDKTIPAEMRKDLPGSKSESFVVGKSGGRIYYAIGADSGGLMYGGCEIAELIACCGLEGINNKKYEPYMQMRGTKFNIPLDVRTPSYTDVCDSAQNNIAEMWSFDFWREYLDTLATYRYNYVSLWSLHPFPSMVKVAEYPDAALDDVQKSTVKWKEFYSLNGMNFDSPEILNNAETLKKITIEEKIEFWRRVMRYGKERNIDFYVVTWNIFDYGTGGKYGITDDINNKTTIDYFRKSVKQMFVTYPDLKGIGLTTGENMHSATTKEKEDWAWNTYGLGVLDAAELFPGRKISFIHRQHQTGAVDIAEKFKPLIDHPDIDFIFSFKYAQAHVMSCTTQPYHAGFVKDLRSKGDLKTIWTLRNDDNYQYRWGAPDFVREFIKNIPYDVSMGYYYGSDQWIWGREFLSLNPESPRRLEIDKHWYHWMMWGRLGFDPDLPNERFVKLIKNRFKDSSAELIFTAWQEASMIYPKVTGYHWGALDFQWYIEACKSSPGYAKTESGFHDVNRFISLPPHESTGYISIPDYVECKLAGKEVKGISPEQVADQIHKHSDTALKIIGEMVRSPNSEHGKTLFDIYIIGTLGKYYAHKISGALELEMYRQGKNELSKTAAVKELTKAAEYWNQYVFAAKEAYKNPLWTNRVGRVDWDKLTKEVQKDIEIARGAK